MFELGDPPANVIISEALARRLWPGQSAVGHRFRGSPAVPWNQVIGVVGHVRLQQDGTTGPDRYFQTYALRQPPLPPASAGAKRPASAEAAYGMLSLTARVDSRVRAGQLYQAVRAMEPGLVVSVEFVDDQYAREFEDRLLATRVISGFGVLAFLVAMAGLYGVMLFFVAHRRQEIGIRMALGADARAISRLVLRSSLWLAALGAALGVGGVMALARVVEAQLFGVRPQDPWTLAMVTLGVMLTAVVASWHPVRQAIRVDPTVLLRSL